MKIRDAALLGAAIGFASAFPVRRWVDWMTTITPVASVTFEPVQFEPVPEPRDPCGLLEVAPRTVQMLNCLRSTQQIGK